MSEINELYQDLIIDHGKNPRNYCANDCANHIQEGNNPLCGDQIKIYVEEQNGVIKKLTFTGHGCAISTASASLLSEIVKGKQVAEVKELAREFITLLKEDKLENAQNKLGKLAALAGVVAFPMRIKCATLPWHTLLKALEGSRNSHPAT